MTTPDNVGKQSASKSNQFLNNEQLYGNASYTQMENLFNSEHFYDKTLQYNRNDNKITPLSDYSNHINFNSNYSNFMKLENNSSSSSSSYYGSNEPPTSNTAACDDSNNNLCTDLPPPSPFVNIDNMHIQASSSNSSNLNLSMNNYVSNSNNESLIAHNDHTMPSDQVHDSILSFESETSKCNNVNYQHQTDDVNISNNYNNYSSINGSHIEPLVKAEPVYTASSDIPITSMDPSINLSNNVSSENLVTSINVSNVQNQNTSTTNPDQTTNASSANSNNIIPPIQNDTKNSNKISNVPNSVDPDTYSQMVWNESAKTFYEGEFNQRLVLGITVFGAPTHWSLEYLLYYICKHALMMYPNKIYLSTASFASNLPTPEHLKGKQVHIGCRDTASKQELLNIRVIPILVKETLGSCCLVFRPYCMFVDNKQHSEPIYTFEDITLEKKKVDCLIKDENLIFIKTACALAIQQAVYGRITCETADWVKQVWDNTTSKLNKCTAALIQYMEYLKVNLSSWTPPNFLDYLQEVVRKLKSSQNSQSDASSNAIRNLPSSVDDLDTCWNSPAVKNLMLQYSTACKPAYRVKNEGGSNSDERLIVDMELFMPFCDFLCENNKNDLKLYEKNSFQYNNSKMPYSNLDNNDDNRNKKNNNSSKYPTEKNRDEKQLYSYKSMSTSSDIVDEQEIEFDGWVSPKPSTYQGNSKNSYEVSARKKEKGSHYNTSIKESKRYQNQNGVPNGSCKASNRGYDNSNNSGPALDKRLNSRRLIPMGNQKVNSVKIENRIKRTRDNQDTEEVRKYTGPRFEKTQGGVRYEHARKRWAVDIYVNGSRVQRCMSVKQLGMVGALIEARKFRYDTLCQIQEFIDVEKEENHIIDVYSKILRIRDKYGIDSRALLLAMQQPVQGYEKFYEGVRMDFIIDTANKIYEAKIKEKGTRREKKIKHPEFYNQNNVKYSNPRQNQYNSNSYR